MTAQENKKSNKKLFAGIVAIVLCLIISVLPVPAELTRSSMIVLGLFAGAIVLWGFSVFPFFVTAMLLNVLIVLSGAVEFSTVFAGIINSTWWLLLGVMGISVALKKTGVMKRLSYHILKLFPSGFTGQVLAVSAAGLITNPFIPSVNAKVAMIMPMVRGLSDTLGYEGRSRGAHGLWSAAYGTIVVGSLGFATANLFSVAGMGMLPDETKASFGWFTWIKASFPWVILVFIAMVVFSILLYRPKESGEAMSNTFIDDELKKMGPMSKDEKITVVILAACVVLWALESTVGIASNITALAGMLLLLMAGIITPKDFKDGVPWDMLLMIASLLGLGGVFKATGINDFITSVFSPIISLISGSPMLFVVLICLMSYVVRFIIINPLMLLTIFIPLLVPFAQAAGISPWIVLFVLLTASSSWQQLYMSSFALVGFAAFGGESVLDYNQLAKLPWVYMGVNLIALALMVPYWSLIGLIA